MLSMRYWTTALATLAAAGGTALAQVPPPEAPMIGPEPPPADPVPAAEPEPPPPPMVAPPPLPPEAAPADPHRPGALSVAIGIGYRFPTSLQTPNLTSVRVRLASGLTFEPRLVLASSSQEVDTGASFESKASELGLGALARFPLVRNGRVDLEALGGLDANRQRTEPSSPDMDLTVTRFAASYGVAVGAWLTPHWQVSLSALNPLITSTRRDEEQGPLTSTVTTTTTLGLIFDPTVVLMVHLYH
jgi:hypothetical protein